MLNVRHFKPFTPLKSIPEKLTIYLIVNVRGNKSMYIDVHWNTSMYICTIKRHYISIMCFIISHFVIFHEVTATELYTQEKFFDTSVIVLRVFEVPENENSPVFNQSTRSVTVTENSLPARILQVLKVLKHRMKVFNLPIRLHPYLISVSSRSPQQTKIKGSLRELPTPSLTDLSENSRLIT